MNDNHKIAFLTPTIRRDLERFKLLSASLNQFYHGSYRHYVIVPANDLSTFKSQINDNHIIFLAEEDIIPSYCYPFSKSFFGIKRHRGWLIQQIVKLSAPQFIEDENIIAIDSDIILIRPFNEGIFFEDRVLKLFKTPQLIHEHWIKASMRILKLDKLIEPQIDYIGNLIGWKRSVLKKMQEYIESLHHKAWPKVFLKEPFFSEYNTYGLYYENILKDGSHFMYTESLTYNVWTLEEYKLFKNEIKIPDQYIGILIQSNIDLDPSVYCEYIRKNING